LLKDKYFWASMISGGFVLLLTLWHGVGSDQASYIYGAWVWKRFHLPPYVGSWDQNFPGIYIIHLLALELFGDSVLGFRAFDFLVQLSCLGMIFYLSKKISGISIAGFIAVIFYGIFYYGHGSWGEGQREAFIFWLLLIALSAVSREKDNWLKPVMSGLAVGFAFLIKPFFGLAWPVFGVMFLAQSGEKSRGRKLREAFIFTICCLLPSLLVIMYYWKTGNLLELYRATIWYNMNIYGDMAESGYSKIMLWFYIVPHLLLREQPLIFFLALAALLIQMRFRRSQPDLKVFRSTLALIAVSLISYAIQAKYFPYHLIPFWGFMIILAGAAVAWLGSQPTDPDRVPGKKIFSAIISLSVIFLMIYNLNPGIMFFSANHAFRNFKQAYLNEPAPSQTQRFMMADHYLAAQYLRPLIKKQDQIEVFSYHPLLAFELKRKLPSRFCSVINLLLRGKSGSFQLLQKKWTDEYTGAVVSARPRFFVLSDPVFPKAEPGNMFAVFNMSSANLTQALSDQFPELNRFLHDNYRLINKFNYTEIYELNQDQKPGPGTGPGN